MAYNTTSWTTGDASATVGQAGPTLYADFFTGTTESFGFAAGYHHILTFGNSNFSSPSTIPNLGNSAEPATSFTVSDSNSLRASDIVTCFWYVPDNIYIDQVFSIEGAKADATDTTRIHLTSFTYNTGTNTVLAGGVECASNSDVTNTGCTKTFFSNFTVSNPTVTAGKVILATFESDSINSDYSINVKVKYHLI